jgi:TonB family protein
MTRDFKLCSSWMFGATSCWLAIWLFPLWAGPQVVADASGVSVHMNGSLSQRSTVIFPADALEKGIEGTVAVQVRIDDKGEVIDSEVRSGPDELRRAVQQSVLTWHFDSSMASTMQVVNVEFSKLRALSPGSSPRPDKILFERALKQIQNGNYEAARLTLNDLINTYPASVYLSRAKLAIADSWFQEGDAHGFAQAAAEYRDFILFNSGIRPSVE